MRVSQWFEEKLQEVESEDQQLRKLHVMVESLVNHRKGRFMCFCTHGGTWCISATLFTLFLNALVMAGCFF